MKTVKWNGKANEIREFRLCIKCYKMMCLGDSPHLHVKDDKNRDIFIHKTCPKSHPR